MTLSWQLNESNKEPQDEEDSGRSSFLLMEPEMFHELFERVRPFIAKETTAKRPAKPPEDGSWDCSVCTYKNSAEAYKCDMCDVRKGTSTRKPKLNPQLVAQQVAQQFAAPLTPPSGSPTPDDEQERLFEDPDDMFGPPPPPPAGPVQPAPLAPPAPPKPAMRKEKSSSSVNKGEKMTINKQNTLPKQIKQGKKNIRPPRLKNIDRSSARQMFVTVDNVTVQITDYQPKRQKLSTELSKEPTDLSDSSSNASNDIHEDRHISDNHT